MSGGIGGGLLKTRGGGTGRRAAIPSEVAKTQSAELPGWAALS